MNKDLLHQLPADEQPVASTLDAVAQEMHLSVAFQMDLETQLMDSYNKTMDPAPTWQAKIIPPLGWAIAAICAVVLLNWTIRSVVTDQPAAGSTPIPAVSFETTVRQGNLCAGPLAVAHGFAAFLSNDDKTGFITLDEGKTIGELRSVAWSPDGTRLALVGNTTGTGNIYFADTSGGDIGYLLHNSGLGYLRDASWSRDGKQLVAWSGQNNSVVFLLKADGTVPVEKQLEMHVLGTPQFTPDGEGIVFPGGDASTSGLFEVRLDGSQTRLISTRVEDESAFAFSPDGTRLAYVDMDRDNGGAIFMIQKLETRAITTILGSLPIPKGSGSSIPEVANLSWSPDGKVITFEFGRGEADRAIYLAYLDGSGLVKVADSAHAPAISADGRCLAYITDKQVFLVDLAEIPSGTPEPVLLAALPAGRAIADFKLDKLQWKP